MRHLPLAVLLSVPAFAGTLQHAELQRAFSTLTRGFDGRVGICAQDAQGRACTLPDERFSLQSVMKLLVAIAAMDAVDAGRWKLDDPIVVRRPDLSLFMQPIEKLVTGDAGYRTTIADLIRRAVVDSDTAAGDLLARRLGGIAEVQRCLVRKGVRGVRLDRDERHLQTEIVGLEWRPEFVEPAKLDAAIAAVPEARRTAAYRAYQKDERDTATPAGMSAMLLALAEGKLLSAASTRHLLGVMEQTVTSPDRLKAGLAPGWRLGHKTGTSSSWQGVTAATNDVGVMIAPDGGRVAIVAVIGDTHAPPEKRSELMRNAAAAVVRSYRGWK